MVPWQSSATCEVRTGFGFFCRQRFGSILRTLAPGAIIAGGGGVATTLSGGDAVAILLKAVVCAHATGGQGARTGSGFWGRQLFEADSARSHLEQSSQVEVE